MTEFNHGGDTLIAKDQYNGELLDFSANLNPLGMPEAVKRAAERAISRSELYPDPFCRRLIHALSVRDGVPEEYILCGNGAADLIFRLVFSRRPKTALVTAPTFSEYEQALSAVNCSVDHHQLTEQTCFSLTNSILDKIRPGLDMLFLCNPNNPTGQAIDPDLLDEIITVCTGNRTLLVLDECFLDLCGGGTGMAHRLKNNPPLFLLRAFTKSYAIPGLRLGYCLCSDASLLDGLKNCAQPWSVSVPAQAAGLAAAECPEHPVRARELISMERIWLTEALRHLGLTVFPSVANYVLFKANGVLDLKQQLILQGILIRSCASFAGLNGDYYRVAVRTRGENELLVKALRRCKGVNE